MQEHSLAINGETIRVMEAGDGPALLFLHGAGGSNWSPMLELLAAKFRVIAPEHPGFGRTQLPDWLIGMGDLAYFYLDVIRALDVDRLHLAGHSLGGWLAAEIGVRNTARLATISLLAPAGVAVEEAPYPDIFLWSPEEGARNQFYDQTFAEARIAALPNADMDIVLQNKAAAARLAWNPRLHNPQLPYWLHRIDVPTQVIWGIEDKVVPSACHRVYMKEIPGARLELLPRSGHSLHSERPAEVAALITRFAEEAGA